MRKDEKQVLERIINNDIRALDSLYKMYRDPFLNYFRRYSISEEEIKDLYQDTMVAFYQKGVQGKLNDLNSSMKTYVFGIGKHKVIDAIRRNGKKLTVDHPEEAYEAIDPETPQLTNEQKKLNTHFEKLGESCQKMLKMFYYQGLDIHEIADMAGYKDANSVKSHKSRCLKQLRILVNKDNG